jgi:plasmid maintenance system killer protein
MNKIQEEKWNEAQKIFIGEDLVAVAQRQLQFLAAVDRKRLLYSSPSHQE